MAYDFDRVIDRRSTESNKWHKFPPDVLPLWVADMDFPSPEPVIRALRERVEHGFFGYGVEQPVFHEVVCERLLKRYGWKVEPEALVLLPGVIAGFNMAARAFASPGDGVLMQLGRTYLDAGKRAEAQQTFNRLVEEYPESQYSGEARRELDNLKKS